MKQVMDVNTSKGSRTERSGQTLVISIIVMFLLAVLAGVFVALVARNLGRAKRMSSADVVYQIAETGIRYADKMLTFSEDGADWRSIPDDRAAIVNGMDMQVNDPDFRWTRPYSETETGTTGPTGGFTTVRTDQGRFLLRLSYNPNPRDPLSKYIKIESIGRFGPGIEYLNGNTDPDPTTFTLSGDTRLRRYLIAYKPIAITDYGMFITNKYGRSADFGLGCPDLAQAFGKSSASPNGFRGFPIRVNGNLSWFGSNNIFLRNITQQNGSFLPIDAVEVTGDISAADDRASVTIQPMDASGGAVGPLRAALWSDDNLYDTFSGQWRDGRESIGVDGQVRSIKRIDPPLISQQDITGSSERYLVATYYSGKIAPSTSGRTYNTGYVGWGRGIYIDNGSQSARIGYEDLFKEWMDTGGLGDWVGSTYIPGYAVMLVLEETGIRATRGVKDTRQWRYKKNGDSVAGRSIVFPYPANGVLYATGDIRIKGMVPRNTQLTVVSGGNIYIEGNLLKFRAPGTSISRSDPWKGADERCSIALLAKKNVVVNTTQILRVPDPQDAPADPRLGDAPFPVKLYADNPAYGIGFDFGFGPYESDTGSPLAEYSLYLTHAGEYRPAYINSWLNNVPLSLAFAKGVPPNFSPDNRLGVGDVWYNYGGGNVGLDSEPAHDVFTFNNMLMNPYSLSDTTGDTNYLFIGMDPARALGNYLFWGAAIQPMDVRIEALCYAEEGSLFLIPGQWLNSNPADTYRNWAGGNSRPNGVPDMFPFYGQALDIRIVIDGAVSQNQPAPMSYVEQWMNKWGRIPATYGSSNIATAHPGEGFTILYDDHCGWPLVDIRGGGASPMRRDSHGRPLPFAPKLPVSPTLIFSGDTQ